MKRYVRASFSTSMPDWVRKEVQGNRRFIPRLKNGLLDKGVALDKCEFIEGLPPTYATNAITFYLLNTDYGQKVYVPGVNDDDQESINGRYRKLGSIAKSKLYDMSSDVVYIDLGKEGNKAVKRDRYRDPRYSYRDNRSKRGEYGGQYKTRKYLGNDEYGPEYWTDKGKTFRNESRSRDKSGYQVPSPEQKIAEYYEKFPEKITDKVDSVYEDINAVKQDLFDLNLSAPQERYSKDNYSDAFHQFSRAVEKYRRMLSEIAQKKDGDWSQYSYYSFRELARDINTIKEYLNEVEELIS